MIVASAEARPYLSEPANCPPIQTDFRKGWPHQRANENQISAVLRTEQFFGPAKLTDRNPVMAKSRRLLGIASAFQGEHDRLNTAGRKRIGERERHDTAPRDEPNRRRKIESRCCHDLGISTLKAVRADPPAGTVSDASSRQ